MARYKISFEIELNDEAGHPAGWVTEAIAENLQPGEDTTAWEFEELLDTPAE
jgi:hypothetical protein